jgi:hypothetical protein
VPAQQIAAVRGEWNFDSFGGVAAMTLFAPHRPFSGG